MMRGKYRQHAESSVTLQAPPNEVSSSRRGEERRFPDPLPVPLPAAMAAEIIAAEFRGIAEDVDYAAASIRCRLVVIEETLNDMLGGRAAG